MKKIIIPLFICILFNDTAFSVTSDQDVIISNSDTTKSTVIFYRQKKLSAAKTEFIVGTTVPDSVLIKLKNNSFHKFETSDCREWEFVGAIYKISDSFKLKLEPGKTYYVQCRLKESFPAVKAKFEIVNESTGKNAIIDMKEM